MLNKESSNNGLANSISDPLLKCCKVQEPSKHTRYRRSMQQTSKTAIFFLKDKQRRNPEQNFKIGDF